MFEPIVGMIVFCGGAALAVKFIDWILTPRPPAPVCTSGRGSCLTAAYSEGWRSQNDWVRNYQDEGQPAAIVDAISTQAADIAKGDIYFPNRYRPVEMDSTAPPEWAGGMGTEETPESIPVPNWPIRVDR